VQHAVQGAGPAGRAGERPALDAADPAVGVGQQPDGGGLGPHGDAAVAGRGGQPGEEHLARGALAVRAVPPGGRRRHVTHRQLTAGRVQVVAVGRVRRLVRAETGLERHALLGQPGQLAHALVAEAAQRLRRHRVADLLAEVVEHRVRGVLDAGRVLDGGAAAGIDHPAGQGRRAAPAEPVEDHHLRTGVGGLDSGAGARGAEADDDDVGLLVPVLCHF
jgi:hypothetical protein